jgi:hypothetical protein
MPFKYRTGNEKISRKGVYFPFIQFFPFWASTIRTSAIIGGSNLLGFLLQANVIKTFRTRPTP